MTQEFQCIMLTIKYVIHVQRFTHISLSIALAILNYQPERPIGGGNNLEEWKQGLKKYIFLLDKNVMIVLPLLKLTS